MLKDNKLGASLQIQWREMNLKNHFEPENHFKKHIIELFSKHFHKLPTNSNNVTLFKNSQIEKVTLH